MKQFVLFLLLGLMLGWTGSVSAEVDLPERLVQEQLEALQLAEIEEFWQLVKEEYQGFLPETQPQGLKDFLLMEESLFSKAFFSGLFKYLFQELWMNGKLLGMIILLTIFSMILEHVQSAFEKNNVSKVAYAVTYLVIFILAIQSFSLAVSYAKAAISTMVHFMLALIPLILALMASMGNFISAGLFHPIIIFLVNSSGVVVYSVVFPLLFFSAVLGIISTFSDQYKVTQLSQLFRNISVGIMGGLLTIFITVVSVQGASAAVADGMAIKAAKFVTGNFVPVVGKMFTEAADTIVGASLLIKNTLGVAGVFILVALCIFPALKVLAIAFIFQLSAAILQPLGNTAIISCLQVIGKNLMFVFAALAVVCFMFFIALTILIAAGNLAVLAR